MQAAVRVLHEGWPTALALAAVALFLLWAWLMPFPELFNGHQHGPFNRLSELWRSGSYPELPKSWVGYDTEVFAGPPQHVFFLSIFSLPGVGSIATRPLFLLPGLFALMTLQVLRLASGQLTGRKDLGSIAFLLACFSYFAASNFTEITEDMLTPLLLGYVLLHVARWVIHDELEWFPFLLVISFTALVRSQVFLLILVITIAVVVVRPVRWSRLREAVRTQPGWHVGIVIVALALPAVTWMVFDTIRYGAPLFPTASGSRAGAFGLSHLNELINTQLDGRSLLLTEFFPAYGLSDVPRLAKKVFAGLSFSMVLTLSIGGFFVVARRWAGADRGRLLRRAALALLTAFLLVLYFVFPAYSKYSGYGAFLLAPFGAIFLAWLASLPRLRLPVQALILAVFLAGLGFWAYTGWGHEASDTSLRNVKFLFPSYGEPADRLARTTGRSPESLAMEGKEYTRALATLGPGQHILFLDLEPGALIPSLLDREFLGSEPYLETPAGEAISAATNDLQLKLALDQLGIRYVYEPGRAHPSIEQTLIMRRLASYDGNASYVIPVRALIRAH